MARTFGPYGQIVVDGGRKTLLFPMQQTVYGSLSAKDGTGLVVTDDASLFGGVFSQDISLLNAGNTQYTTLDNTTEQTVLSIPSGSGVLTSIVCPIVDNIGDTITIRVTADGNTTTYTRATTIASERFCIGGFVKYKAQSSATAVNGYLSASDSGFDGAAPEYGMLNPMQAVELGYGKKFESSLTVTIQVSSLDTSNTNRTYCGVAWLDYVPEGI